MFSSSLPTQHLDLGNTYIHHRCKRRSARGAVDHSVAPQRPLAWAVAVIYQGAAGITLPHIPQSPCLAAVKPSHASMLPVILGNYPAPAHKLNTKKE